MTLIGSAAPGRWPGDGRGAAAGADQSPFCPPAVDRAAPAHRPSACQQDFTSAIVLLIDYRSFSSVITPAYWFGTAPGFVSSVCLLCDVIYSNNCLSLATAKWCRLLADFADPQ